MKRIAGKSSKKNNIKPKKIQPKITTRTTVIPKTKSKTQKQQPKTPNPHDSENPLKESQSGPKDITGKDIEKDLIENDPSKGFETDMDKPEGNEFQSGQFQRSELKEDNPVNKEFEIGQLRSAETRNDELSREEIDNDKFKNDEFGQ